MPIILIIAAVLIIGAGIFLLFSKDGDQAKPVPQPERMTVAGPSFEPIESGAVFCKPGPNKRVCGYLLDLLIISIIELFIRLVFKLPFHWSVFIVYWLLRDSLNGQSIGKKFVGLQIVNEKGQAATPLEGIMRNIPMAVPFVSIIEYFVMLRNNEAKRIGDFIAHTKVTDLNPHRSDKIFLWFSILALGGTILLSRTATLSFEQNNISGQGEYLGVRKEIGIPEGGPFANIDIKDSNDVIDAIMNGDDQAKLSQMERILKEPGRYAPPVLYLLSHLLFELGEKDKAAFWFYAGQLRARFDANRCADESAKTAVSELNEKFGPQINQYALQDLNKLQEIVKSVLEWDAATPYAYDHRWINLHGLKATISALEAKEGKTPSTEVIMSLPESQWEDIHKKTQEEYWAGFQEALNSVLSKQETFYVNYQSFFTGDTVQIKVSGDITFDEALFLDVVGALEKQEKIDGRELFSEVVIKLLSVEEEETLWKQKWTVTGPQGVKEYWVILDSTPPPGFPYKIKIEISNQE